MKKEEIIPGARIKVKNGKAVIKFLESLKNDTAYLNPFSGRAPFSAHPYGSTSFTEHVIQNEGEEFEIVLAPKRKKVIYNRYDSCTKYVAVRRISDDAFMETLYISVLYDTVPA